MTLGERSKQDAIRMYKNRAVGRIRFVHAKSLGRDDPVVDNNVAMGWSIQE